MAEPHRGDSIAPRDGGASRGVRGRAWRVEDHTFGGVHDIAPSFEAFLVNGLRSMEEPPIALMGAARWRGAHCVERPTYDPRWEDVEAAIRRLDGVESQDVFLIPSMEDDETWCCIGGGAARYIITGSIRNQRFPTFVDRARSAEPPVTLTIGGQAGEYDANWVVDLETTLTVARAFYDAGGFDCDVAWMDV